MPNQLSLLKKIFPYYSVDLTLEDLRKFTQSRDLFGIIGTNNLISINDIDKNKYKNKSFLLNKKLAWSIIDNSDGNLYLVPTKK